MTNRNIDIAKNAPNPLLAGLGTFMFTVMTRANWSQVILNGITHYFLFSTFAGVGIAKFGFYLYDFLRAKNKNAGKVTALLREGLGAALMTTAVLGGFFATIAFATVTPILFTIAMGINALHSIATAAYAGYKYATTSDEVSRAQFKQTFIKYSIGSVLGIASTVGVALLMVFKIAPLAMAISLAAVNGIGFILSTAGLIHGLRAAKAATVAPVAEEKVALLPAAPVLEPIERLQAVAPTPVENYFSQRQFVATQPAEKVTELREVIKAKMKNLSDEIKQEEKDGALFSQNEKRLAKLNVLKKVDNFFKHSDRLSSQKSVADQFDDAITVKFAAKSSLIAQSFFRQRSDTDQIVARAREIAETIAPAA